MSIIGAYVTINGLYISNPKTKETCKEKSKAYFFPNIYQAEDYAAVLEEETGEEVVFTPEKKNIDFA